jgi:CBS domain-containing protein
MKENEVSGTNFAASVLSARVAVPVLASFPNKCCRHGNAMMTPSETEPLPPMVLAAKTAADLMVSNPISIHQDLTVQEATALLIDKGFSAAPVIDDAGTPVGIVSRSDILAHEREKVEFAATASDHDGDGRRKPLFREKRRKGSQVVEVDATPVRDIMTPVVFSVAPYYSARQVVTEMLALNVHRLFVVDRTGVLVGIISTLDVLRHLR